MIRPWLVSILAAAGLFAAIPISAAQGLAPDMVPAALRQGGYILFMRHGTAGEGNDRDFFDLGTCADQRRLSDSGIEDAKRIGAALKRLQIPVGRVLTSPYCRAKDTALLAFGYATVDYDLRLLHGKFGPEERNRLVSAVRNMAGAAPAAGTNTAIVTHNNEDVLGTELAQGEIAILRPDGKGGFTIAARVLPTQWGAMQP